MILLQVLAATIQMCFIPYLVGCLFLCGNEKAEKAGITYRLISGLMVTYALFEVICISFQHFGLGFRAVTYAYLAVVLVLAVTGLVMRVGNRKNEVIRFAFQKDWFLIAAFVLIGVQIAAILLMATPDKDDAFYSGISSMSLSYDYLLEYHAYSGQMNDPIGLRYVVSALPVYQASLTLLSGGLHHLFITHNLFPLFYMPLAYAVYYRIAKRLFEKEGIEDAQGKFMLLFALLHMIGNFYVFSPENFLVTRMWQGKALFVALGVPFLWHYGELALSCSCKKIEVTLFEKVKYWLLVLCGLLAVVFMGETGLYLGVFMFGCQTLASCLVNKTLRGVIPAGLCCVPSAVLLAYLLF